MLQFKTVSYLFQIFLKFKLIREFLGRACWKEKSKNIAGDVTVGTKNIKIICPDRVSVGLSCDVNLKWHMLL